MAVFDLFKRLVSTSATAGERRADERVRAELGARVLVVDDSATIRAVLGKMLVQDGYEVLKAPDGESAIELAQSRFPDLIFLDIVLPGMSGFAVLRALRRDSRTRTTPIVMMSGNQQATEQFYVQRFGADGFVKKPFGRSEVFHAIRSLVQAERMPARAVVPAPADAIPEGISAEEWNAIPDVAMPDEAHMADRHAPGVSTALADAVASPSPAPAAAAPSPAVAVTPVAPEPRVAVTPAASPAPTAGNAVPVAPPGKAMQTAPPAGTQGDAAESKSDGGQADGVVGAAPADVSPRDG